MIHFAIVGFGNIGKRHAKHILDNKAAKLVAVCDNDITKKYLIEELKVPYYQKYDDLLKNQDIDVVCICTPNYLHKAHTIAALESGKHTITEKPFALSVKDCDDMIQAEKQYNKIIFAVKQNRYNPPVQQVKKCIDNQDLGEIFSVQVNCFWNRNASYYSNSNWRGIKEKDGGCLFTQFSHFIDILYYLCGNVKALSGYINNFTHPNIEIEDIGSFILKSEKGAIINFNYTTSSFEKNMEGAITIFGTKGTVKIGGQYLNTIAYQNISNLKIPVINISGKENDYGTYKGSMSNHDKVIQNVIDVLLGNDKIMTTSLDGRAVVSIIEDMYQVAESNKSRYY